MRYLANKRKDAEGTLLGVLGYEEEPLPDMIPPRALEVTPCDLAQVQTFIEAHHYSHNTNGVKVTQCFQVTHGERLVGGVVFGPLTTTAWRSYADDEAKVWELRRLVLLDCCGRNSESRVVGWVLRWIRNHAKQVEVVVSYADPAWGHGGTIYRATNFTYVGLSGADKGYHDPTTGKTYHSRTLRNKYKGTLKPFAAALVAKLEEGQLDVIELPGKHTFIYRFDRRLPSIVAHSATAIGG